LWIKRRRFLFCGSKPIFNILGRRHRLKHLFFMKSNITKNEQHNQLAIGPIHRNATWYVIKVVNVVLPLKRASESNVTIVLVCGSVSLK